MSAISDRDYRFVCQLVYERSRICLGSNKKELVSARLGKRLRQLGLNSYSDYCKLLDSPSGPSELANLIDAISTNFTNFFRENKHFEFLQETILKEWRSQSGWKERLFCVWSAVCSSGEEPYSIAMVLAEQAAAGRLAAWQIQATDISTRMLTRAQRAVYEEERIELLKPEWLRRYFQKGIGEWNGAYRIKPRLRNQVYFLHLNLLQSSYPFTRPFQVIFCRNVMIYFDRPTQEELAMKLWNQLAPGGYLLIGHSETLSGLNPPLKMIKPSIYQKSL